MTTQARFIGFTLFMAASLLFQARADITTGLVGYWKFTDGPGSATAADATANANNGTLTGFSDATHNSMWTTSSDPNNTWPYALIFNQGSDTADYVSVPDSASLDTIPSVKKFTLAAWVNLSASPGSAGAAILCRGTGGGGEVWCMDVYQSHFRLFIRNSTGGNVSTAISTNVSPSVGTWYHVVGTYDAGATLKLLLYVNGVKQGDSGSGSTTTLTSTNRVVSIGNRQSGTGPFNLPFPGTIDEVRIYNTTLAATDVAQLYAYKAFPVVNKGIGSWNGLAGGGGNATLDTTSLNFCTNLYTAPVGTADSLADLLNVQSAGALPLACSLADFYYSGGNQVAVQSTNLTLASGGVAIGTANGPGTLTCLNVSSTYTLTSPDTIGLTDGPNPTALAQSGHGTVILIGTNTFSGSVNINSGTVQLGNGNISVGQELGSTTSITDNGALVFNGTNALDFTKTLSGMGSLTVRNCPSLTLNTGNNYSGGTTLVNTTLTLNSLADGGCPLGTGPVTLNGATLLYTGAGDSTVRQFIGTTGTTNAIDVPASVNLELANRLNAAGAWIVNKTGGGTLTLSGTADNSWLGMNITTGTVVLNKSAGATGAGLGGPTTVASGALLQLGNTGYGKQIYSGSTTPITISSGGVLDMDGQANAIYSLSLAGVGSGSGALINSLGSTTAYITNSGTGVVLADNTLIGGVGNLTFLGPISGGYTLTYGGSATLTLAGSGSSYSGGTAVTNGTLDVATALAIPGNVTLSGPATLELDDPNALPVLATLTLPSSPADNTVYLNFSGSDSIAVLVIGGVSQAPGTYGAPGSGATYTSTVFNSAGAGVLNVTGQGNWDPSRSGIAPGSGGTGAWDTTTANWLTASGGVDAAWPYDGVAVFAGAAGTVTLTNNVNANGLTFATAGYTVTNDGASVLTLDAYTPVITIPGNTTIACALAQSGTTPVTVTGSGTLTLSGANTYAGGTVINGATLSANSIADANCSIGPSGSVTIQGGGALSYTGAGAAATVRNVVVNGPATATLNVPAGAGVLSLNGQVKSGSANVAPFYTKTGTGTLILGGSVDNSGCTMAVNQGTVVINKTSTATVHGLGGGASSVANGAELQLATGSGAFDIYHTATLAVSSGGLLDVNGQTVWMSTLTLSGTGSGNGALINSAPSTTCYFTNDGSSGIVLAGNTTIGGPGSIAFVNGPFSGGYSLTYAGTGTLTLPTNNTFTGGMTINSGGTVQLLNPASAGTGAINMNGSATLGLNVGNTSAATGLSNAVVGGSSSIVNISLSTGNLYLLDDLSGFSGTFNVNGASGTPQLVVGNGASYATHINANATWNIYANGWVDFNVSQVNPARVNLYGMPIASGSWGSLRLDASTQSGNVVLYANSSIGNGQSTPSTVSGVISESGGSYGFTKMGVNANQVLILTATNTYSGPTTNSIGTLQLGGAGLLGSGNYATNLVNNATFNYASSAAQTLSGPVSGTGLLVQSGPGVLTLAGTNTYTGGTLITNGSTLTIGGGGCLGVSAGATNYAGNITNYGIFNYASSAAQTLSGLVSGNGTLAASGPGKLTLRSANTYTGPTVITNNGTLVLASGGSINSTPSIAIAAGSTFDTSAYSTYSLVGGITLNASGTGTAAGSTAAAIQGATTATITLNGPLALTYTPTSFSGDATHPALFISGISQGQLVLVNNAFTVNNAGASPLGAGTYSLIQVAAGGTISAGAPTVTVTGHGLAAGATASIAITGNSVNLVVSGGASVPGINSITLSGTNFIFSGTNGPNSGTYYVLATTNVTLPLSNWPVIETNSFSPTGTFIVTNAVGATPWQFFSLRVVP